MKNKSLDEYFDFVTHHDLSTSSRDYLRFHLNYLFKNISFDKKTMLDIGGGYGLYSFYAACMGADEVICIEPEAAGSDPNVIKKFKILQSGLRTLDRVKLEVDTLQNFNSNGKKFDIILLYNSINHLDEKACINLQHDTRAIETYMKIFQKLRDLANNRAKLIIADCSRYNFFNKFNIRNPFVPMIEWHKHQPPKYWAKLLFNVGFCNPKIRWTSFNQLYSLGRVLLGNKISSYFFDSHFCLTMEKI